MASAFSETFVEFKIVVGEFNRLASAACGDMHSTVCRTRQIIRESRELIAKVESETFWR